MQRYNVKGVSLHLVALLPTAFFKDRGRLWRQKQHKRHIKIKSLKLNHFWSSGICQTIRWSVSTINRPNRWERRGRLTWGFPGRRRRSDQRRAATSGCRRFSGGPAKLSDRTTPGPGRAALPPDGSDRESSSNTWHGRAGRRREKKHNHQDIVCLSFIFNRLDQKLVGGTYFLATDRASASASWIPFFIVSIKTVPCL